MATVAVVARQLAAQCEVGGLALKRARILALLERLCEVAGITRLSKPLRWSGVTNDCLHYSEAWEIVRRRSPTCGESTVYASEVLRQAFRLGQPVRTARTTVIVASVGGPSVTCVVLYPAACPERRCAVGTVPKASSVCRLILRRSEAYYSYYLHLLRRGVDGRQAEVGGATGPTAGQRK